MSYLKQSSVDGVAFSEYNVKYRVYIMECSVQCREEYDKDSEECIVDSVDCVMFSLASVVHILQS